MRLFPAFMALAAISATASAQVRVLSGTSPNTTTTLDFDTPFVPSGVITGTDPTFTANGIASVAILGTWMTAGDLLTATSNVNGQGLVVDAGGLAVGTTGDPLDGPSNGAGVSFTLSSPVDEFGLTFTDQVNFSYSVELFSGATSLGVKSLWYGELNFPAPGFYARGPMAFDRVEVRFTGANGTGGAGFDTITLGNGPASDPLPDDCAETSFGGGNNGNVDGAVYFDLTTTGQATITSLMTHFQDVAGTPVGLQIYTTTGSYVGKEADATQWTLVAQDDGSAVTAGVTFPTTITLATPLILPAGTTGITLLAVGAANAYTNGDGFNEVETSADGSITISGGSASNTLFDPNTFTPRIWNGRVCSGSDNLGTNFCNPAVANSTGASSTMSATGSTSVTTNALTLETSDLPPSAFAFMIVSQGQVVVNMPGGSLGNLCLAGAPIGRYVGPGQIQQANASGEISLTIDLSLIPQPAGFVAGVSGDTWNFQTWHRDAVGGVPVSNFSDGLEVTLTN